MGQQRLKKELIKSRIKIERNLTIIAIRRGPFYQFCLKYQRRKFNLNYKSNYVEPWKTQKYC